MTTLDGGPAFPIVLPEKFEQAESGMSLRDYFAAQALSSSLSDGIHVDSEGMKVVAKAAYEMADAMIAERDRHD